MYFESSTTVGDKHNDRYSFPIYTHGLAHGTQFHLQQPDASIMMPPNSHAVNQPTQRAMGSVVKMNDINAGSVSIGPIINGQSSASPHASSFAAALRKLAKKAVDPVTDQEMAESSSNMVHGNHSIPMNPSPDASLSLAKSPHYKRPPPPPLIQTIPPPARVVSSEMSIPTANNLVHDNSCKGLDYSLNRDVALKTENHSLKKGFYVPSADQHSPSSFHSIKQLSSASSNIPQIRPSGNSPHYPEVSRIPPSTTGYRLYPHQNIPTNHQSKSSNLPINKAYDSKNIAGQYSQIHPAYYSSPSQSYRFNSEPTYLEPYSSLLRPSLHPNLMLPPNHLQYPSSGRHASPNYTGNAYANQQNSSEIVLPAKTNYSSHAMDHDRHRADDERFRINNDGRSTHDVKPRLFQHSVETGFHSLKKETKLPPDYSDASVQRIAYRDVSSAADQREPLSLMKPKPDHDPKPSSHHHTTVSITKDTSDMGQSRPMSSQLPKERFKHLQLQKNFNPQEHKVQDNADGFTAQQNHSIAELPVRHYSIPTTSHSADPPKSTEPRNCASSSPSSHSLPVRVIEAQRSYAEPASQALKTINKNSNSYEMNKTKFLKFMLRDKNCTDSSTTSSTPEDRPPLIFNPAFMDKETQPPLSNKLSKDLVSKPENNIRLPVVVSKLDFELRRLEEYRQYNRFNGSDQSDDDDELTDVDEDELDRHEETRKYHLMTITSGPPIKLNKSAEKVNFLKLLGLTTHKSRSVLELKRCKRQQRLVRNDLFPDVKTLVKDKISCNILRIINSADSISTSLEHKISDNMSVDASSSPDQLKFLTNVGLHFAKNNVEDEKKYVSIKNANSPSSEESVDLLIEATNGLLEQHEILSRKRSYEESDLETSDEFSNSHAISPKLFLGNLPKNSSDELGSISGESTNDKDKVSLFSPSDNSTENTLSSNFAQEFHNSVLQTTKEQQAHKTGGARTRTIGRTQGGPDLDEAVPVININQSEFASSNSNIYTTLLGSKKAPLLGNSPSYTSATDDKPSSPPSSILPPLHSFKWPGIQAIMEAYERHYDLQKLEKDILSSQCQCLKLKNRELANLAEKLRSRMCDLINNKRQLDNERQKRQYDIDNLKRCIKNIR